MTATEVCDIISTLDPSACFDVGIFLPSQLKSRFMPYSKRHSLCAEDIPSCIKSVVVFLFFTDKAFDYHIRDRFTPLLIRYFQAHVHETTGYDKYRILRKEAAFLAGLGKIGRNSLLFSHKFGFNCKIDLILTGQEFVGYYQADPANPYLPACKDCQQCVATCPVKCRMNFGIDDWRRCDRFITPHTKTPESMCRNCIENCEASNAICRDTFRDAPGVALGEAAC